MNGIPFQYFVGAFVTMLLFCVGHLGMAIWFASKINNQMTNIAIDVGELTKDSKLFMMTQAKIEYFERRLNALETGRTTNTAAKDRR
jgi:small-conductance mechanosensitive channel